MKIAFLYTLTNGENLFAPYIKRDLSQDGIELIHLTQPALLQDIIEQGETTETIAAVQTAIRQLAEQGADLIICTCSTIGDLAETTPDINAKVLRVDRPMAETAAKHGKVQVLAALESTIIPTCELIKTVAQSLELPEPDISYAVIPNAWECFAAGDKEGYYQAIQAYIDAQPACDRISLLAQASMSPALREQDTDILSSPASCIAFVSQWLQAQ